MRRKYRLRQSLRRWWISMIKESFNKNLSWSLNYQKKRKTLRLSITFIDRENNNYSIFEKNKPGNGRRKHRKKKEKEGSTICRGIQKLKLKRACRIISKPNSLIHNITFNGNKFRKWIHNGRRVGRPRMNWAEETVKELWDHIKREMTGLLRFMEFDDSNDKKWI